MGMGVTSLLLIFLFHHINRRLWYVLQKLVVFWMKIPTSKAVQMFRKLRCSFSLWWKFWWEKKTPSLSLSLPVALVFHSTKSVYECEYVAWQRGFTFNIWSSSSEETPMNIFLLHYSNGWRFFFFLHSQILLTMLQKMHNSRLNLYFIWNLFLFLHFRWKMKNVVRSPLWCSLLFWMGIKRRAKLLILQWNFAKYSIQFIVKVCTAQCTGII